MMFVSNRINWMLPLSLLQLTLMVRSVAGQQRQEEETIHVKYGYFAEARPIHAACGRGWLDLSIDGKKYEVACHPQTSGNFAASRLDSNQLQIANLGSTPLAQAVARGIDLQVVYISHYMGDSQGIYVRPSDGDYVGITNPFDLRGRTIGVPFGSTMHYQVLFLLDLFGLTGNVNLIDLSPSEIIKAWDDQIIDAGACWGAARDYLLKSDGNGDGNQNMLPANTLMSAGVLANWGRPTFVVIAANQQFAKQHRAFMNHFVSVISRINDSFLDRLGEKDTLNVERWNAQNVTSSLVPSMSDALMNENQIPQQPSARFLNSQRRALDLFIQQTSEEQLSCSYLGRCDRPTLQHIATHQTAEFLMRQKIISNLGQMEDFERTECSSSNYCSGTVFDPEFLDAAQRECPGCYPVGSYNGNFASDSTLLSEFERLDLASSRSIYASNEIGRIGFGNSYCSEQQPIQVTPGQIESFGDGANTELGRTYSANLNCSWEIRGFEDDILNLKFDNFRIWSGDYLRIYTDEKNECQKSASDSTLLAQISGTELKDNFPPIRAKGCMYVTFETDGNQERSYGDPQNLGDGFMADVSIIQNANVNQFCNGFPVGLDSSCRCDGFHWGGDCTFSDYCLGTTRLSLDGSGTVTMASSGSLRPENVIHFANDPAKVYPNNLDCTFEIEVTGNGQYLELSVYYDVEEGHDFIWLETGIGEIYYVLTGTHQQGEPDRFYVPIDRTASYTMKLRLTTDSRGRRGGFYAEARIIPFHSVPSSCPTGFSGTDCEIPYCQPMNKLSKTASIDVDHSYLIGSGASQEPGRSVRPMPWGGGCEWNLWSPALANGVSIRILFAEGGFDLEAYPEAAAGDKFVIQTSPGEDVTIFSEECENDEVCSHPWQTGVCGPKGGCLVDRSIDIPIGKSITAASAVLMTDRNDGGEFYAGVQFDAFLVNECPEGDGNTHCEAVSGGKCVHGGCVCEGGVPCSCPCDGDPPRFIGSLRTGLVVGIVVPLFLVFIGIFIWYRRRKILKSRAQKDIIQEKEAQLEAFRNSMVGMRTAIAPFIPTVTESSKKLSPIKLDLPDKPKIQWCWQETSSMMHMHDSETIVGDPNDCFIVYDKAISAKLEAAFQKQGMTGKFSPMHGYSVDFGRMVQTKVATGFERRVQRLVQVADTDALRTRIDNMDMSKAIYGDIIPSDLSEEPQVVLVEGDVIQISSQREDGWAFGSKLHHSDEAVARELAKFAVGSGSEDEASILTDTGWFQLEATEVPSAEDLAALQTNVGSTDALNPPDTWDEVVDPSVVKLHKLKKSDIEYEKLLEAFLTTLKPPGFPKKVKVLEINRIQNLAMWQSYVVKRQTIAYRETGLSGADKTADDQALQRKAIERFERSWLWHGTNIEVMDKIMQQGFNRSFCGKNATVYGKGVYFARDARYSAYPTYSVPDSENNQYIMACRVVVGEYCRGTMNALTPDVRDAATQSLYDSTVGLLSDDTMSNPSIYVTYHDSQAYPEYLIKFRLS